MKKRIFFNIFLVLFLTSSNVLAENSTPFKNMFFTVVSSGSDGGILGHTYLTFCPDMMIFDLTKCRAIEYNLDINLGEKFNQLKKSNLFEKLEMFENANFRVYEHLNAQEFSSKYLQRGKGIDFYRFNGSQDTVQIIYENIQKEKEYRNSNDINDYSLLDNNCVTKIIDVVNQHSDKEIIKENESFFDFNNFVFRFPIYVKDRLLESKLFDSVISISNNSSKSRSLTE